MNKSYLLVVCLLAASFTGCLADDTTDSIEQGENIDEETINPLGEDNMTSFEKRLSDLETKITEYEMPKVYFVDMSGYNLISTSYEYNLSEDGFLLCSYIDYYDRTVCYITAQYYDIDGLVSTFSWEASETGVNQSLYSGYNCRMDVEPATCFTASGSVSYNPVDVCNFGDVSQRLTLTVYDNDGNSASVSYDLDYDAVCV